MYPKVNQTIIINTENHTYKTMVSEILDEEILIGYPIVGDHAEILPPETQLEILFVSADNMFKFTSEVIGRKKDNIALYRIKKPKEDEVAKVQRRENFRVPASLDLTVGESRFTTINISGGGLLFSSPTSFEIKEGQEISCVILVPTTKVIEPLNFQAKVARVTLQEDPPRKNIGVEFTMMDERSRTKVIQYCFEKQRQNRAAARS